MYVMHRISNINKIDMQLKKKTDNENHKNIKKEKHFTNLNFVIFSNILEEYLKIPNGNGTVCLQNGKRK